MPPSPNVPSFDLDFARSITHRLRRSETTKKREKPILHAPRYAAFDASRIASANDPLVAMRMPGGRGFGAEAWNQLLDGCVAATQGHSAFLMDLHGLLVAHRGRLSVEETEVLAARLCITVEQAAKLGECSKPSIAVCIEMQSDWLSGLRFSLSDGSELVLGVVSEIPLTGPVKEIVEELLFNAGAVSPVP